MTDKQQTKDSSKNFLKSLTIAIPLTLVIISLAIGTNVFGQELNIGEYDRTITVDNNITGKMEIGIADGIMHTEYITSDVNITMKEESGKQLIEYQSTDGKITRKESLNETLETVETPKGQYTEGYSGGYYHDKFKGLNKTDVKQTRTELKEDLEILLRSIENEKEAVKDVSTPEFQLEVNNEDEDDTYFEITNNRDQRVDMENWIMEGLESETGSRDAEHIFENIELEPGETLKVYTESDNQISEEEKHTVASEMTIYQSSTDTVVLTDNWTTEIARKTYNQ